MNPKLGYKKILIEQCEANEKGCSKKAWRYNETVRRKGTENVKILNICKNCFEKITGAK